jgi:glycerol-3-phosphate dehydrogenase
MKREAIVENIKRDPEFSVLVIGGGVNGIGAYRDLALQGVDVLLVEKADFCSGASAASSHMAHGGVRYLENGEFRLVREAVRERNRLIQNAAHYVKPLPTVIPMFKWFSGLLNAPLKFLGLLDRPSERGAVVIKIGLMFYDAYTKGQGTVPRHEFMFREKALQEYPRLNPDVLCVARYYDGAILSPERLCVDLLHDVEDASARALSMNYCQAVGAEGGEVTLRDELSGDTLVVRPDLVINAAGPWIDFVNQDLGQATDLIGGTKGSHIILENPELREALKDREFFFENRDGRIVLIFPLFDKVLVGTSDIFIDDPEDARCTEEEVDYFLEMIDIVFPDINVDRSQILFRFSGVRPLPTADIDAAGQVSRDHSIEKLPPGGALEFPIWSLVGGKWTSFRAFAEQVADHTLSFLGRNRETTTRDMTIGGGDHYPENVPGYLEELHDQVDLPLARLEDLFERYGTRAEKVAAFLKQGEDRALESLPSYSDREIRFIVRTEQVNHIDDFLLRRSVIAKLGKLTRPGLDEIGNVIGRELDWTEEQVREEIHRAEEILREFHQVELSG